MSDVIHIGDWVFTRSTGVLKNGDVTNRLEHRAASLLDVLCRENGELVTHADIIETVWEGRSISPNSIAVVIADIRRALGDDAKQPKYLETLPKRGYRMKAPITVIETVKAQDELSKATHPKSQSGGSHLTSRAMRLGIIGGLAVLLGVFIVIKTINPAPKYVSVSVSPITNHTQDAQYEALAFALTDLLETELMRTERYKISLKGEADIVIGGRVILWSGHAALSLRADAANGETIIWSGMASGPEDKLPFQLRREIEALTASFDKEE